MNKKGFTLIEMLAVVLVLGLLTAISVGIYNEYLSSSRNKAFTLAEESFKNAVVEAYLDCSGNQTKNTFCSSHKQLSSPGETATIYLNELVNNNYIDAIKNPYDTDEFCDLNNSYVIAKNSNDTNLINVDISYTVCLMCSGHISEACY